MASGPGVKFIENERLSQITKGYVIEHDRKHGVGELVRVAACLLDAVASAEEGVDIDWPHALWPEGWDASKYLDKDAIQILAIAGALSAAAIDLLTDEVARLNDEV